MHTFSINAEMNKQCYLEHIKKQMLYSVNTAKGIQTLIPMDDISYLEIMVEDDYKERISYGLKNNIAEVISLGFKTDYLNEKLGLPKEGLINKTLINTMSIFDNAIDKKMVLQGLDNLDNLSLDGYFRFRLKNLKTRWDEIISVTNGNGLAIYDDAVKIEFMQYLLTSIPSLSSKITIDMSFYGYTLYDVNERELSNIPLIKCGETDREEELMFNLMCLSPKSVMITGDEDLLSLDFIKLCKSLFTFV